MTPIEIPHNIFEYLDSCPFQLFDIFYIPALVFGIGLTLFTFLLKFNYII